MQILIHNPFTLYSLSDTLCDCLSLLNLSSKSLLIVPAYFPPHIFLWHFIIPHSLPLNFYAPYSIYILYVYRGAIMCCICYYFSSVSPSLCFEAFSSVLVPTPSNKFSPGLTAQQ